MAETKITFDAADDYERFMGRWSRAIGEQFLDWLDVPAGSRWLDIGCGTGALSQLIASRCQPQSLDGIDPAPAQIAFVQKLLPQHSFQVGDATSLPYIDATFDAAVSALVIHFIAARDKAFAEMRRTLRPGGLVGGYTWKRTETTDHAAYAPMLHAIEAIGGLALRSPVVREGTQDGMRAALEEAGFTDIAVREIRVTQTFPDFDAYWQAQTYPFSPTGKAVAALDQAQAARLRALLRETLPAADGSITYPATTIAAKACKPR